MDIEKLKFPVGKYVSIKNPDKGIFESWIKVIEEFPSRLEDALIGVSYEQLNWNYRPEGWTVKQVVHHCADSHMNSIIRFKLALTEETPTIRPYYEDRWALLVDSESNDITDSLMILKGLHSKWIRLIESLSESQLKRAFSHPEHGTTFSLVETIGLYAWHCNHHLAHVIIALDSKGIYN